MGKIYSSEAKTLPRELRERFDSFVGKSIIRPFTFAAVEKKYDPDKEMIVEGIANLAEPDRWGEIIVPEAWNKRLKTFKANPIMLYEHWRENAIGTCLEIKVKEDGLYYKACIGDPSKAPLTPTQAHVRSLLAQGILRTNSVGFIPHVIEWDEDDDVLRYTDVELLEISIVAIPMQQDSVITSVKSWRGKSSKPAPALAPENEEESEMELKDMKAALEASTQASVAMKASVDALVAKSAETETKLKAEIEQLKAENAKLKAENEAVKTKTAELVGELKKAGIIKD